MFNSSPNQDAIVSVFSSTGFPECADCYKLLHQFWCAQTVPSCGIFDKVIDEILVSLNVVPLIIVQCTELLYLWYLHHFSKFTNWFAGVVRTVIAAVK
jgi:hypothetical protein